MYSRPRAIATEQYIHMCNKQTPRPMMQAKPNRTHLERVQHFWTATFASTLVLTSVHTKRRTPVISTAASESGASGFESRFELDRGFSLLSSVRPGKRGNSMLNQAATTTSKSFLIHYTLFIISFDIMQYSLRYRQLCKISHKRIKTKKDSA